MQSEECERVGGGKKIKGHREIILGPGLDEHIAGIASLTIIHAADIMCVCERERELFLAK